MLGKGLENMFPGKEVVYQLVSIDFVDDDGSYEETLKYLGTDYEKSRDFSIFYKEDWYEFRHRVYVDSQLIFEGKRATGDLQWVGTYDYIEEVEAELDEANNRVRDLTAILYELGQIDRKKQTKINS
jgi:hypothetical protein